MTDHTNRPDSYSETFYTDLVKSIQQKIDRARATRNDAERTADTMQKLPESQP